VFSGRKISILFLPTLFGCLAMSPQEKNKHKMGPVEIASSISQGLDSGFLVEGNWPEEDWWNQFQSPSLNLMIQEAIEQNPSLKAIESRVAQAKQAALVNKSKLFPTLFFNADDNWRHLSKHGFTHLLNPKLGLSGYEVDLSLSFQYEFDFWGKYRNLFRSALGEMKAEEAEFAQAKLVLTTSLAQSYFGLLISKQKEKFYQELCAVRLHKLTLQKKMVAGALSSILPPLLDDVGLQEANENLLAIRDEIATQKHLINILRGVSPDVEVLIDPLSKETLGSIYLPKNLSMGLLSRRPDLMAQIWRVEALANQVSAAKADFFPNVNIVAFAGLCSTSFSNLFQVLSQTTGADPALTLPIFTGGSIRANLKKKKALFDEAVYSYNQLILVSVQEVADLLTHIETAFAQKQLQQISLEDTKKRLELTNLRKAGGLDAEFAPLNYQEEVIFQSLKDLGILYNQYAFTIKLIKALGGGYQEKEPL
jgi:NodT family efflux transporter outer membrane factor (OMF) lipoprotein